MANQYSKIFSLKDIFNNPNLKGKIPLVNYREIDKGEKVSVRTNMQTVASQVYQTSIVTARPYYKPLNSVRNGNTIVVGGKPIASLSAVVDAVFTALQGQATLLSFTANNMSMIRSALKEGEKSKRVNGGDAKLYLRAQSMEQIEGMSKRQIQALMDNVMENILYSDKFPETQSKYGVENLFVKSPYNYLQRQQMWKNRVGEN